MGGAHPRQDGYDVQEKEESLEGQQQAASSPCAELLDANALLPEGCIPHSRQPCQANGCVCSKEPPCQTTPARWQNTLSQVHALLPATP